MRKMKFGIIAILLSGLLVSNASVQAKELKNVQLPFAEQSTWRSIDSLSPVLLSSTSKKLKLKLDKKFMIELKKGRIHGLSINKNDTQATLKKKFGVEKLGIADDYDHISRTYSKLANVEFYFDVVTNKLSSVIISDVLLPTTSVSELKKMLGTPSKQYKDSNESDVFYKTIYMAGKSRLEFTSWPSIDEIVTMHVYF